MDDYTHLRKAHKDEEKEALLSTELSPTEAKECLDNMKEISALIEKVTFPNLSPDLLIYYYIGRHYLLKIGVYLFSWIHCCIRSSLGLDC